MRAGERQGPFFPPPPPPFPSRTRLIFALLALILSHCTTLEHGTGYPEVQPLIRRRCWLAANKLTLHTTKTEFLLIGSRQRLSTLERNLIIEINKFPIKHVSTSKSLGVLIKGNLFWECHINEISKKIASGISAIKCRRYFLPFEILLTVYNSLVKPHFDYCNVV